LSHAPIVRELRRVGVVSGVAFQGGVNVDIDLSWKPNALRFVVFVQETRSRRVRGVGAL
jgi:hypothetical protein